MKGGREGRDVDALQLAQTTEKLGAGEILLNCIDKDGTNSGFDIELINHIRDNVSIPVIASSGAGKVEHFSEVFEKTKAEAALAAGIFHREEVPIEAVKQHMRDKGIETHNLLKAAYNAFDAEGISIPFPQRDIHIKTSNVHDFDEGKA